MCYADGFLGIIGYQSIHAAKLVRLYVRCASEIPSGSWLVSPSHTRFFFFSFAGQSSSKRAIANASRVLLLLQSPPCYIYIYDHVTAHRAGRCDRKCERRGDVIIQLAKSDRARFFPMVARGAFCREPKSKTNKKISVHVRVCESDLTLRLLL